MSYMCGIHGSKMSIDCSGNNKTDDFVMIIIIRHCLISTMNVFVSNIKEYYRYYTIGLMGSIDELMCTFNFASPSLHIV